MDARGRVLTPLDREALVAAATRLRDAGVDVLTLCFLNSFANPAHEREAAQHLRDALPDLPISISSDVLHEFREYERATTTVMNAYVQPRMRGYLTSLGDRMAERELRAAVSVVRSDGGLMSIAAASATPVHTMLSGPSGGVNGAILVARRAGYDRVVTFDMGGTSTDVALCLDGQAQLTRETHVGEFPVKAPSSTCRRSAPAAARSRRSPRPPGRCASDRSRPAPTPARRPTGGAASEPTVSDANLVLGYLPPRLVGGDMALDVSSPAEAVGRVARAMEALGPRTPPPGIIDIVNEIMLGALRVITVQRGLDPRDFGARRLRRRRPAACQRPGAPARLLPGAGAARPGRSLGARLPRSRLRQRVRADPHPPDRRPEPGDVWSRFARSAKKPAPGSTPRASRRTRARWATRRPALRASGLRGRDRGRASTTSARSMRSCATASSRARAPLRRPLPGRSSSWPRAPPGSAAPTSRRRGARRGRPTASPQPAGGRPCLRRLVGGGARYDRAALGVGTRIARPRDHPQYDTTTCSCPSTPPRSTVMAFS